MFGFDSLGRKESIEEQNRRLELEQEGRSYKRLFATPDGKVVLKDLLRECHIFVSTFRQNGKVQDFLEGKRAIGLYLLARIEKQDLEEIKNI